ncbi:MAG: YchJ family metal-binding protein [Herbiconiux sp.]|nr:YchJ family metal-binding protein [Herbiconiux sp.]
MSETGAATTPDDGDRCPCLSGEVYGDCCGPFHRGTAVAPTAERLMRSRYAAFAVGDVDYLLGTWHPSTRPESLELDPELRWFRLDIDGRRAGGPFDTEGEVEFTAHYRVREPGAVRARAERQHERSRFERVDGRWFYLDAV